MAAFPTLRTGAVAQYPSLRRLSTSTRVTSFVDGSEQRFREFAIPIQRWVIRLNALSEPELVAIEQFFNEQQGGAGTFSFVDPWDGNEYPDCSFDVDTLTTSLRAPERAATTVVIRNNQV